MMMIARCYWCWWWLHACVGHDVSHDDINMKWQLDDFEVHHLGCRNGDEDELMVLMVRNGDYAKLEIRLHLQLQVFVGLRSFRFYGWRVFAYVHPCNVKHKTTSLRILKVGIRCDKTLSLTRTFSHFMHRTWMKVYEPCPTSLSKI